MSQRRVDHADDGEEEMGIASLKKRATDAGADVTARVSDALSPAEQEEFWRRVVECETGESATDFERLIAAGVDLPPPDAMNDAEVTAKLWQVIRELAGMNVFLSETDHLSDRELYALLWHRVLREEGSANTNGWVTHVGLVSTGSEEDTRLYLKYYADEKWREWWQADFPDDRIPAHEAPPYSRDRVLPKPPHRR